MEDVEHGGLQSNGRDGMIREPLINQQKEEAGESSREPADFAAGHGRPQGSLWMVLLSTAVAVCGSFVFGACIGYSAPTQTGITSDLGLSIKEYSIFGSILTIGAMIGAMISGRLADWIGRKGAMGVSAVTCTIGWLLIIVAKDPLMLYFGRLFTGYGIGVISYVVPVFIAEIAPKDLRGGLTTTNQLLVCLGISTIYIIGSFVSWRSLALVGNASLHVNHCVFNENYLCSKILTLNFMQGLLPCLLQLLGLAFIPESPRWLAKAGHSKEFKAALQRLRGRDADVSEEAKEIQEFTENLETLPKASFLDLFGRRYRGSVIVGVGLMLSQQLGGVNGVNFYASEIFVSAGFSSGSLGTILMGIIQVPITLIGATLIDRSGRRSLLMVSASGMMIGCFMTGSSFYLKAQGVQADWVPSLALFGILVYIGTYSIGMGAVPWVIMSEIFPFNIKGIAGSFVTSINWTSSWAVSYAFNFIMTWNPAGTFFMFAGMCALTILFAAMVVPETKGRSLEEIHASLNS